jgi:site-specific DNA-methyltransferase (adenine-specific)
MTSANKQRAEAIDRARALEDVLTEIGTALPLRTIAAELNDRGIPTARGGQWHAASVGRAIQRIGLPNGIEVHVGDCRSILPTLNARSVDCCVTSPPYLGCRDYDHPDQIGMESDIKIYLGELVKIFRQVRRVLKDTGTLWLVIGDCWEGKDRLLLPARLAMALQKDGWILRDEIIWHKSRATPAPVIDRTVAAHEFIYMFSKYPTGYHYNYLAIEEPAKTSGAVRDYTSGTQKNVGKALLAPGFKARKITVRETRRKRSVWSIAPQPSVLPHFAMFPSKLAETCILAGCPSGGTVLDPFAGLGTTGLAALRTGRRGVLIEINEKYAELARQRLIQKK